MHLLASWGFTPAPEPHAIGGSPDLVLSAQCWALPGLDWQLLARAACELFVAETLRISDKDEADVGALIRG
jgi:hypothetical protein